jgi:hypothetical protein
MGVGCLMVACSPSHPGLGPTPNEVTPRCKALIGKYEDAREDWMESKGSPREEEFLRVMNAAQNLVFEGGCVAS